MDRPSTLYRVTDWDGRYENNRTRGMKVMQWVPVPNKHDGDGYTELLDHPNGPAHFACWVTALQVASRCGERGTLLRDNGQPHDTSSLSRITRIPAEVWAEALPRIIRIGWLSSQVLDTGDVAPSCGEPAVCPHPARTQLTMEGKGIERKGMERKGTEEPPLPPQGGAGSFASLPDQRRRKRERPDPDDPAEALARDMVRQINGGRTLCRDVATGLLAKGVPVETVRAFLEDASPDMTPNAFQEWVVKEYLAPGLAVESQAPRCAECGCESSGPSAIRLVVVDGVTKCESCAAGKAEPCPECGALWPADEFVARRMSEVGCGPREVVCCAKCGGWSVKRLGGVA